MTYCRHLTLCLPKPLWPTRFYSQMNKRCHQICNVWYYHQILMLFNFSCKLHRNKLFKAWLQKLVLAYKLLRCFLVGSWENVAGWLLQLKIWLWVSKQTKELPWRGHIIPFHSQWRQASPNFMGSRSPGWKCPCTLICWHLPATSGSQEHWGGSISWWTHTILDKSLNLSELMFPIWKHRNSSDSRVMLRIRGRENGAHVHSDLHFTKAFQ